MEERDRANVNGNGNGPSRISPEIYVYATNKNFLNLYDALRIDKVKIEIAGYDQASNRQTGLASAWLDVDDVRLLTHLITHRLFAAVSGGKWEKYGGSQREDGHVESRTFAVEWDEGDGGRFSRYPYRVTIANGPGKRTATGGVAPDGAATSQMSMRLPEADMIKTMLVLRDYVQAYESAHHHRIVADRVRELREKLGERVDRNERPSHEPAREVTAPAAQHTMRQDRPAQLQSIQGGSRRPATNGVSDRVTPMRARSAG